MQTLIFIYGNSFWNSLDVKCSNASEAQWKTRMCPRKQRFRLDKNTGKVILEVHFHYEGIIHYEFIPNDKTVNKELYVKNLCYLRKAIRTICPEKWAEKSWVLFPVNAPTHQLLLVKHNITTLEHSFCSRVILHMVISMCYFD